MKLKELNKMINDQKIKKTWVITTFFNSQHYQSKLDNYYAFKKNLELLDIPLVTVECAFNQDKFELSDDKSNSNILIQVRSNSVLWQKERLLNIALKNLPTECENIVWADADVIFLNNNWLAETEKLLETYQIVQPFSRAIRLSDTETVQDVIDNKLPENRFTDGYALFSNQQNTSGLYFKTEGGFAWAGKKYIFDACGFFDVSIIGGADWQMNKAFVSCESDYYLSKKWLEEMKKVITSKCYFTEGTLVHLYHGTVANRFYAYRFEILAANDFDPERDLCLNEYGCWEWSNKAPEKLKSDVKKYFRERNEDDNYLLNLKHDVSGFIFKTGLAIKKKHPKLFNFFKKIIRKDVFYRASSITLIIFGSTFLSNFLAK